MDIEKRFSPDLLVKGQKKAREDVADSAWTEAFTLYWKMVARTLASASNRTLTADELATELDVSPPEYGDFLNFVRELDQEGYVELDYTQGRGNPRIRLIETP